MAGFWAIDASLSKAFIGRHFAAEKYVKRLEENAEKNVKRFEENAEQTREERDKGSE